MTHPMKLFQTTKQAKIDLAKLERGQADVIARQSRPTWHECGLLSINNFRTAINRKTMGL